MRLWIRDVSKRDARLLVNWWNAHSKRFYFRRKNDTGKLWGVWQQI